MTVVCRPARAEDLEHADALVVASINDLTLRDGFGPWPQRVPRTLSCSLRRTIPTDSGSRKMRKMRTGSSASR